MYEELVGEHIVLRKAKEDDYKAMLTNIWSDEEIYKWMMFAPTKTIEEAIERNHRSMEFQKDHYAYYVALKDTDEPIGLCGIKENELGHYEECGIGLARKCQGKGYGKEVVSLLLELAFQKLGAQDFTYNYDQDNLKSSKLAAHFHFHYDHTKELIRPWDGKVKTIDSCILTKEMYEHSCGEF